VAERWPVKEIRNIGPFLQLGWVVALAILIPLGLGLWLDHRCATSPLFVLIGALVGIIVSTIGAVRLATRVIEALGKVSRVDTGHGTTANEKEDKAQ
jgi:F0F1-type ATP synthase assembly protein I